MSICRRIFTSIIVCGLLFGCGLYVRLQLSGPDRQRDRPAPDFLPNVQRYRTSRVCSQRALVLVTSAPDRSHRRQVIRETWAHPAVTQSLDMSVAFGVGTAGSDDVQRQLDWEAEIYGDVFQAPSTDTRSKSATRAAQLLKAVRGACAPMPQFVMKAEDDVFVNIHALGDILEMLDTYSSSNTLWCLAWNHKLDRMGYNDTWLVQKAPFGLAVQHPRYCVSAVYLMTGRALDAILRRHDVQTGRTLLPEDVYVTGILPKEAGTQLLLLGDRSVFDDRSEEVNPGRVAFAYLGDRFEEGAKKLWGALVKEKLSRRSDVGL